MSARVPAVLRHRDFNLYWFGVVFSQIGTRGTVAANLYQVYVLTHSVTTTGFVGLAQAVALLVLSPVGGAYADRVDRRRLLQGAQAAAMVVAAALAASTIAGKVSTWQVLLSVVLTTAAASFDQPARQALIPAMVPRAELPQAFALLNPSRELAVLIGPALAGLLIAVQGAGLMYVVDAGTYLVLVVVLAVMRVPRLVPTQTGVSVWTSIREGAAFVRGRTIVLLMISLDLSATLFGAYRVVLPALALSVLHVGPAGYGLLSAAPSAGALLATYLVFRVVGRSPRLGRVLLLATIGYGLSTVLLAQGRLLALALLGGLLLGGCDAMATTIRQAAVQLETPDAMRGPRLGVVPNGLARRPGPGRPHDRRARRCPRSAGRTDRRRVRAGGLRRRVTAARWPGYPLHGRGPRARGSAAAPRPAAGPGRRGRRAGVRRWTCRWPVNVDVGVVGGGPVRVGLAVELGLRGNSSAAVERWTTRSGIPKGQGLSQQSLEHFWRWGVAEQIRQARATPPGYPIGQVTAASTAGLYAAVNVRRRARCAPPGPAARPPAQDAPRPAVPS